MPDENMSSQFCLSIAVPIYNEESTIPELLQRTRAVLDRIPGGPHELLFVDDGSSDRTLPLLEQAAHSDPRISVIALSRNFGHQAALSAALDHAVGDAVVLMDGDLQDAPEDIPLLAERHREGYDVVYATRATRQEGWPAKLSYFLFYRLQAMLSDTRLPLDAGDFGLMSRRVVDQIRHMPERQRYLRGLRSWVGFRQLAVPLDRAEAALGSEQIRIPEIAEAGLGRHFRFLRGAASRRHHDRSSRSWGVCTVRPLLRLCQVCAEQSSPGFYCSSIHGHVPLRSASVLPWHYWRVCGKSI